MKTFYIRRHFDNIGPYTIEELQTFKILTQEFIWEVGTKDWVHAKEIVDLLQIIDANAPPNFSDDNNDQLQLASVSLLRKKHSFKLGRWTFELLIKKRL